MNSRMFGGGTRAAVGTALAACLVVGTGGGAAVAAPTSVDPVEGYVERVYEDLLGRGVDPQGLTTWAGKVRAGVPRIEVANGITGSDEFRTTLIHAAYEDYLGRGADPQGLGSWLAAMRRGATIQRLESGFLASPEYVAAAGEEWVQRMYLDVLGRGAAPAEADTWEALISTGKATRQQVATGILLSDEHLSTVIDATYEDLLGRRGDPIGRHGWVAAIQAGIRLEQAMGGILASSEYYRLGIPAGGPALHPEGRVGDLPVHATEAAAVAYLTERLGTGPEVLDPAFACAAAQVPGKVLAWDELLLIVPTPENGGEPYVAGWLVTSSDPTATTARLGTAEGLRIGDPENRVLELYPRAEAFEDPVFMPGTVWVTEPEIEGLAVWISDNGGGRVVTAVGSGYFCGD